MPWGLVLPRRWCGMKLTTGFINLWWTNILPWKITIFNGKIHYFDWAIFNCYVSSPEGMTLWQWIRWQHYCDTLSVRLVFFRHPSETYMIWSVGMDGNSQYDGKVIKSMFHYWLLSHENNTNKNPIKSHVPVTTNQITMIFPLLLVYSLWKPQLTINHQPGYPISGKIQSPPTSCWMAQLWIPSRPRWIQTCATCLFRGNQGNTKQASSTSRTFPAPKGYHLVMTNIAMV